MSAFEDPNTICLLENPADVEALSMLFLFNFRSIVNDGENEYLTVGRNSLYIAGVPPNIGQKSIKQWHLRNDTSFIGKQTRLVVELAEIRQG